MEPITITPEMTVLDVVSQYRETEAVFKRYDELAGECICCNSLFETLVDVAKLYHFDVQALINDLKCGITPKKKQGLNFGRRYSSLYSLSVLLLKILAVSHQP